LQPSYPGALLGGSVPPAQTPFFNSRVPAYVIVVVIDPQAREHVYEECAQAPKLTAQGDDGLTWLKYAFGSMPPDRVFFLTIATSERGEGASAFSEECLKLPNFPASTIDALSPSPKTFFTDFTGRFVNERPGQAMLLDMCEVLSSNGGVRIDAFVHSVHQHLGMPG